MDGLVASAEGFNPDLRAWVVISRSSTNPSVHESEEAGEVLDDFSHLNLSRVVIRDRIAYRKAARDGLCVNEMKPKDPKAVAEVDSFFKEVFGGE